MNFSDESSESERPSDSFRHFPNDAYGELHQKLCAIANGNDSALETFLADIQPYLRIIHARLRNELGMTHVIDDHDIHDIVTDSLLVTIDNIRRKRSCDNWSTFAMNFLTKVNQRMHTALRKNRNTSMLSLYDEVLTAAEGTNVDETDDEPQELLLLHETIPSRPSSSDAETARISKLYDALVAEVNKLPERMASVVKMRFGIGCERQLSRGKIAVILNIRSSDHVRIIEDKALKRLHLTLAAYHLLETFEE